MSVNVKGGPDEQMLFYQCLKKWLVGMVASWVEPKVVNHEMLVLIGEQGTYKTTWFSHLVRRTDEEKKLHSRLQETGGEGGEVE